MKKTLLHLIAAVSVIFCASSCFDDNVDVGVIPVVTDGVYILNSGMMNSNNAELTVYNPRTDEVAVNVFMAANGGKRMGDSANDMIRYGSRLYFAVTGSAVVFATDMDGKIVKEITVAGETGNLCPRQITAGNGKVYVTYREGYVAAVDTATFSVKKAKVGPYPEGIVYAREKQKLYVAITDGNNYPNLENKVQVLDSYSLDIMGELEVGYNPQTFHVLDDQYIYLVCWGDYAANPAMLQKIDTRTDEVTVIKGVVPTNMTIGYYKAYILSSEYDENWNQIIKYYVFDTDQDEIEGELISSDLVPNGYCIYADPYGDHVYIGTSDYVNNGDIYIVKPPLYGVASSVVKKFDTGAINPYKMCFAPSYENKN